MPDAPVLGGATQEGQARRRRVRRALQRAARARERARRAGRAPPRHGRDEDPRHGLRRRRQAVAPEGHRPRPRRLEPLADLDRRRRRVRPAAALLHLQGQPQGAARGAAQRAVAARRARLARDPRRGRVRRAEDEPGVRPARRLGSGRARRSSCSAPRSRDAALSFRNIARVAVLHARERRRRPTSSAPPRCSSRRRRSTS